MSWARRPVARTAGRGVEEGIEASFGMTDVVFPFTVYCLRFKFSTLPRPVFPEGWPSGLRHQSRKLKYGQLYREFKSHPFRHRPSATGTRPALTATTLIPSKKNDNVSARLRAKRVFFSSSFRIHLRIHLRIHFSRLPARCALPDRDDVRPSCVPLAPWTWSVSPVIFARACQEFLPSHACTASFACVHREILTTGA